MRNLRSPREIAAMRPAGLLVWKAHQAARTLVRPGINTKLIDDVVTRIFADVDATPLFLGYPGKAPFPAATCISVNEEIVHGIPGNRVLAEGDIVSIDTGCRLDGWCGDAAVTHPVGTVSAPVMSLLETTQGVLDLAIRLLGEKQMWSEVAREMGTFVRDRGFSVVEEFVGHAIGREMHEKPQVPNYYDEERFRGKGDFKLKPGIVLAIEPMVNMGTHEIRVLDDHWTAVTADGRPSAHFEHTVALTADGPVRLTGPPTESDDVPGRPLNEFLES